MIRNCDEHMKKIEDILTYKSENWETYQQLLKGNFIPVIGAGLSAGLTIGNWDDLLRTLAEKVFGFHDYGEIPDNIEDALDEREKTLITDYMAKLEELDKQDMDSPGQIADHVKERIAYIKEFVDNTNNDKKIAYIGYAFFIRLLNRKKRFSSYEAAELLERIEGSKDNLTESLHRIINLHKTDNLSEPETRYPIFWLVKIIGILKNSEKKVDCFTINFDDVIERVCLSLNTKTTVKHLHGCFDEEGHANEICLTLSDLLRIYGDRLNEPREEDRNKTVIDSFQRANINSSFLFVGTSFSEGYIGRLAKLKENNYGIYPLPDSADINVHLRVKRRMMKFGISQYRLFYPVDGANHEALEILLHQLFRDLECDHWNNWWILDFFDHHSEFSVDSEYQIVDEAVSWLKEMRDVGIAKLYVNMDSSACFDKENGILNVTDLESYYYLCNSMKEKIFPRPFWSAYWEGDRGSDESDEQPLGNTVYFYLKMNKSAEKLESFDKRLKAVSEKLESGWECKEIILDISSLPPIKAEQLWINYICRAMDKISPKESQYKMARDIIANNWEMTSCRLYLSKYLSIESPKENIDKIFEKAINDNKYYADNKSSDLIRERGK